MERTIFLILTLGGLIFVSNACAIEKPDYEVLERDGKKELRQYGDIPVASAPMKALDERNGSFRKLFRYIQGDNDSKQKIAMTAPVFMETPPEGPDHKEAGRMSFMIPAKVAAGGAPAPEGENVSLGTIKGGTFAVIRFKGHRSEQKRTEATAALEAWVAKQEWTPQGEPFLAYYDPPWTPEALRRNEVWLRVTR